CVGELNDGRPAAAPGAARFRNHAAGLANRVGLLPRRQLHHAPRLIVAQRREDLAADAEIRMVHVRRLHGLRKAQRQLAGFLGGHALAPYRALSRVRRNAIALACASATSFLSPPARPWPAPGTVTSSNGTLWRSNSFAIAADNS